jgi:hypothetical protein
VLLSTYLLVVGKLIRFFVWLTPSKAFASMCCRDAATQDEGLGPIRGGRWAGTSVTVKE